MKNACFFLIASLFLLGGCSKDPDKILVGRWQETGNPKGAMVFSSNHTGRAYWPDKEGRQQSENMTWVVLKKENKVSVITPPGPVNFEIKGDRLIAPNGVVLTKVK